MLTKLRWTILILSFFILLFGAYAGLYFGYFIPTFSCCYVRARAGTCFMLTFQQTMGSLTWESIRIFLERFLYFSLLVIVIGRAWCGWICPLGFFQDVMDKLRRALGFGYIRFSAGVKKKLAWIKWTFFSVALALPVWAAFPVCPCVALNLHIPYCQLCPGKYILPLLAGNPDRVAVYFKSTTNLILSALGLTFSIATLLGAMVKRRFFCTFCPLGLIMSWYRKISFLRLHKNDEQCTHCQICYNACPQDIQEVFTSRGKTDVTTADCTLCLKCVENCPEDGALSVRFLGKPVYSSSGKNFFSKKTVDRKTQTPLKQGGNQ